MSGILLNGTTGYLKLSNKIATSFPFSFVAYIASAKSNSTNSVVNQQQDSSVGNAAFLDFAGGGGVTKRATYYSNTASKSTSPDLNNTNYQVIAGTYTDVNNCTVYFGSNSGILSTGSGLPNILSSTDSFYIGARNNAGIIQLMEGSITEVHIYNVVLTTGNIQTLVDKSANPETITGWVDGWSLLNTSDLVSLGGTRTLSAVGGVSNSSLAAPFSRTAPDVTAPILTSATGTAASSVTANVEVTTDEGNGTLYSVVTLSATQPSIAQIKAGQNNAGTAAAWSGNQSISTVGVKSFSSTGLTPSTTYYAHFVHTDAASNDSNRISSSSFTTSASDTTPPNLTVPTGTATGSTTANASVTTDEANGTLYYVATINATETASFVKTNGASTAVSSSGVKNVSFTGLSASTTYYAHFVHRDAAGNDSTRVSSGSFTTTSITSVSVPLVNNTNTSLASITIPRVTIQNLTDGVIVLNLTSQSTNGSGVLNISSTSLVAASNYVVTGWNADGSAMFVTKLTAV